MTRYRHLITDDNRKWWTLGAMCFALFMVMLDNTVVNVALPSIQRELGAHISQLEWVINGYTLTFAVLIATGGRLGDIFGRRRMFLTGVIIFAITSATAGFAQDPAMLIGSRAIQGIGAALMMPATLSIITHTFPAAERGRAIGIWAGVSALALSIGPVVGGALTEYVSWRAIFFINLPVAVAAVAATVFAVRESRDETVDRHVDYPGIVALTTSLTAIVLALIEGNSWGWGSTGIVSLLAGGVIGLAAFVAIELRVTSPMVEFALFRTRQFIGSNLIAFIITFAMMGTFFFMAIYMQDILGYGALQAGFSALEAGIRFLPTTMVIAVVAPISGRLADRLGPGVPMSAGLAVLAVSMFMFAAIDTATTYSGLLVPFILMGLGIALVMSPMSTAAMNAVSVQKSGVASGVLQMSRMVGASVGVAATGAIFQAQLGSGFNPAALAAAPEQARATFVDALGSAMLLAAIVVVAGLVVSLLLIRRSQGERIDTHEAAEEAVEAIPVEAAVEEAVPAGAR
jgi:EmrB/QacA subfamily drug resistance transporter